MSHVILIVHDELPTEKKFYELKNSGSLLPTRTDGVCKMGAFQTFPGSRNLPTFVARPSLISFLKIWRRCTRIIDDPGVEA